MALNLIHTLDPNLVEDCGACGAVPAEKCRPWCTGEAAAQDEDPSYVAWCEEQDAIHEGRAVQLTACYLCPGGSPLRGIIGESTCNPADPTALLHLSCGHRII